MSGWGFGYPGHPSDEVLKAKEEAEAKPAEQNDADNATDGSDAPSA
ncbi:MAG TPA: hypothetical protein VLC50_00665 [Actinomycetes bacterium]|nr:hypothetical protein [Actinomycetes bacterium]